MMKRPFWFAAGAVAGAAGTLWAEQRIRRTVDQAVARLAPNNVANEAVDSVRQLGGRVRAAVEAGRAERDRREAELWDELEGRPPVRPSQPAPPARLGRHAPRGRHAARGRGGQRGSQAQRFR